MDLKKSTPGIPGSPWSPRVTATLHNHRAKDPSSKHRSLIAGFRTHRNPKPPVVAATAALRPLASAITASISPPRAFALSIIAVGHSAWQIPTSATSVANPPREAPAPSDGTRYPPDTWAMVASRKYQALPSCSTDDVYLDIMLSAFMHHNKGIPNLECTEIFYLARQMPTPLW